jgi:hypothetical protein
MGESALEPPDRIADLLAEIRDIQQAHYAEYQRTSQEFRDLNRSTARQYEESAKWGKAWTWGLYLLIAMGFAANIAMLVQVREAAEAIQSAVERTPKGSRR